MKIVAVKTGSPELDAVIELWRGESDTLGFMPRGGFDDAAAAGTLLAALSGNDVVGYVLFRLTQHSAVIVHLCVKGTNRGSGLARGLFEAVKAACGHALDVRLSCRRDFPVARLWPKLGFVAAGEKAGRGKDGTTLTVWRYELDLPPLLKALALSPSRDGAVRVVLDANVFFGLGSDSVQDDAARGLGEDWLAEFLDLLITDELFNEIERKDDAAERQRQRTRANSFRRVIRNPQREEQVLSKVRALLQADDSPSGTSDARHVAMAIAGDVGVFVTSDQGLLDRADDLDAEFGLQVKEPFAIIREFDELRRQLAYRPRRLFLGPSIRGGTARAEDVESLADLMHMGQPSPEPRRTTVARLKAYLAQPDRFEAICIWKGEELLAAYFLERPSLDVLRVPFVGVAASSLGVTAARHYLQEIVAAAARENRSVTELVEPGRRVTEALLELGFSRANDTVWIKVSMATIGTAGDVIGLLNGVVTKNSLTKELVEGATNALREVRDNPSSAPRGTVEVETRLWPLKLTGSGVPNFIVPIRPRWARELFDRELATGMLFGVDPHLVLNAENVYYRAARPSVLVAPARVLWYVSQDEHTQGSMAVRACSRIDEVIVGRPKELFSRFKRLGVYKWDDVLGAAGDDLTTEIMAFRFSGTELFSRPIPWDKLQKVLSSANGKQSPLASPISISEQAFFDLYREGTGPHGT